MPTRADDVGGACQFQNGRPMCGKCSKDTSQMSVFFNGFLQCLWIAPTPLLR